ncbi:MAG: DUF4290 domain-containing protein [Prevotella sp.]|nr:DUF4290 domain-containing protein [Prevotella sp.]
MNIDGLDYNTQREQIVLPEYGREIQQMVDYAVGLPDREERQRCARAIITIMDRMFPESKNVEGHERKLWDQLAIMSRFQLDIDYPFDVTSASQMAQKPEPMPYPMKKIPVRHYGAMLFEAFEILKTMEPGRERDELVKLTANQMHRNLMQWSHGSSDGEKVASDLARFTDGKIQLDLDTFKFERFVDREQSQGRNGKKKNK